MSEFFSSLTLQMIKRCQRSPQIRGCTFPTIHIFPVNCSLISISQKSSTAAFSNPLNIKTPGVVSVQVHTHSQGQFSTSCYLHFLHVVKYLVGFWYRRSSQRVHSSPADIFNYILWSSSISMSLLQQFSTEYERIVDLQHFYKVHQSSPNSSQEG